MGTSPRLSTAAKLISKLLDRGVFTVEELAREIVVTPPSLRAYRSGRTPVPFDRQLCLALLVIERVPEYARQGRQLRAQIVAAMEYEARVSTGGLERSGRSVFTDHPSTRRRQGQA